METLRKKKKIEGMQEIINISTQVMSTSNYGPKKAVVSLGRFDLKGETQIIPIFFLYKELRRWTKCKQVCSSRKKV